MLISKIEIQNFRSITDKLTIYCENSDINIFVGANNVGKSNILRAINLFFNKQTEPGFPFSPNTDLNLDKKQNCTISIEFQFSKTKNKALTNYIDKNHNTEFDNYKVPITLVLYTNGNIQYSFTNKLGQKKTFQELLERILDYTNCVYIPAIKDFRYILNIEMMKKIVAATFQGWGKGRTSQKLGEQKEKFQDVMGSLQSILDSSGNYMSDLISNTIPAVKRFDFSLPYSNLEDFLGKLNFEITEAGISQKVSLDNEGSGIQSFTIYSMLKLLHEIRPRNTYRKAQFIWLIEEPETFLHNDLQRKTFKKLKEYSKEGHIFITTHSPVFIDKENYKNTYHVTKNGMTYIRRINTDSIKTVIAQSLGVTFDDYFLFKRYNILVEGLSDKNLIEGLNKLFVLQGEKNHINNEEYQIIVCGSANSIPHFFHMYNAFNNYASFVALFDRDDAGLKARQELIDSGITEEQLLLIPKSDFKEKNGIEDVVDKSVWDKCLDKLDADKLITIKMKEKNYVDYEFLKKDRIEVKKNFTKYLLEEAVQDLSKFNKYLELIKNCVIANTNIE